MVATAVTLNDLEGHSPLVDVFKCNPLNICAAFYTISTDSVIAWFLCIAELLVLVTFSVICHI